MKINKNYQLEYEAFLKFIHGQPISFHTYFILFLKSMLGLGEMMIRYIPGGVGYKLRYWYYKLILKKMGKNVLIEAGVFLNGTRNISLGDYVWIDGGCRIDAMLGEISIGKRVHVAPYSIIAAREPIIIEDYVGIASHVRIYSNSEVPLEGKRMSGPMIPEEHKAYYSKRIILEKDSFVGTGSVLLPGAYLGEGAVVGANSIVSKKINAYNIVVGPSARVIGKRKKVNVPEL